MTISRSSRASGPRIAFAKALVSAFLLWNSHSGLSQNRDWIATWTASPEAADPDPDDALLNLNDQTVRERVRVSVGGLQIRIVLSNEYGSAPLALGRMSVGLARGKAGVVTEPQRVTFGGRREIRIAAGATVLSDPIDLPVRNDAELAVSLYIPKPVRGVTWHSLAMKQAVISKHGDHTRDVAMEIDKVSDSSVFLKQVLVPSHPQANVLVTFGDSIVDGDKSTPEADDGWPHDLFRRLLAKSAGQHFSVVNEGIAGNRLLRNGPIESLGASGLTQFQRDALDVPGVTHIVLLEGTNDIGFPEAKLHDFLLAPSAEVPTAEDMIRGYKQVISRSHARGIRVIGCTIMPTEGAAIANYHTDAKERTRLTVNDWIRTGKAFDGVIDFDTVMRDPAQPGRLNPRFASDDYIHPNAIGYQKMADAVDLSLFK